MVTVLARAKVNLRLAVLAREASGYHQIETLFCALALADEISLVPEGDGIVLSVEADDDLGPARENLVHRAAEAFFDAARLPARVRITLRKRIPAGAGLGGGSSDAAATLHALNGAHGRPLPRAEILRLAGRLGSDVPFFAAGVALALAWGRGERLLPLPALPERPVVLVVPAERVATADAYAALARSRTAEAATTPSVIEPAALHDWDAVATVAVNDFDAPVFERLPALARIRDALRDAGARPALLAGSGSAVFGVFGADDTASSAAETLRGLAPTAAVIRTRTAAGPPPHAVARPSSPG